MKKLIKAVDAWLDTWNQHKSHTLVLVMLGIVIILQKYNVL